MLEGNLIRKAHQSLQVFVPLRLLVLSDSTSIIRPHLNSEHEGTNDIRFSLTHVDVLSDSIYSTYRFT